MIYGPYLTAQHSTWHVPTWIFMSDLSLIGSRKWSVNSIIGRQIAKFALAWWGTNMLGEWNWTFRFIRFIYYSNDFWITIYQLRLSAWNDTGERKPAEARASLSFACFVFCVHSNYYPLAIKKNAWNYISIPCNSSVYFFEENSKVPTTAWHHLSAFIPFRESHHHNSPFVLFIQLGFRCLSIFGIR